MLVFNSIVSSLRNVSSPFCVFFLRWLSITVAATNAVVDGILVMRVCALYNQNYGIKGLALLVYFGGVITHIGLTVEDYVAEGVYVGSNFGVLPGCYADSVPAMIAGYWITPLLVETMLFALIMIKAYTWSLNGAAPPALVVLARDSVIYYFIIFVLLVANLLVFEYGPPSLDSMMLMPSNTAGCIAGSRMLLNLRALAEPEPFHDSGTPVKFVRHRHHSAYTYSSTAVTAALGTSFASFVQYLATGAAGRGVDVDVEAQGAAGTFQQTSTVGRAI